MSSGITRRQFLALSAVGLTAAGRSAAIGANERIRVGIIGCGTRGAELIQELIRLDITGHRVQIAGVCDAWSVRRSEARRRSGAQIFRNWKALIERSDIDAVVIATPDHWHASMSIAAMQSGKHVYCESPMTRTLSEAVKFRDTAKRTDRVVQIGARETSQPQWRAVASLIEAGRLGKVRWSQAAHRPRTKSGVNRFAMHKLDSDTLDWQAFLGEAPPRPFDTQRFLHWQHYWDYAGDIAQDRNFDRLAALLMAIGPELPERVSAAGGVTHRDTREVPDAFMMTAKYKSGHSAMLSSSRPGTISLPATIRGDRASVECYDDRLVILSATSTAEESIPVTPARAPGHLANWLVAMRENRPTSCNAELGFKTMTAVAMGLESYRKRTAMYYDARARISVART